MSRLLSALAVLTFIASVGSFADAKSCKGPNGKFVKCAKPMSAMAPAKITKDAKGHCHGANGKFVKCPK
jgi:hypothetical protein